MAAEITPKKKMYKLAEGEGLIIPGLPKELKITNDNVNDPNIQTIILNAEARSGRKYFGSAIVEK